MGIEILVLGGQERLDHPLGNGADGDEGPFFGGIFRDQAAVSGMNAGHDRRLIGGELLIFRQSTPVMPEPAQHRAGAKERQQNKCDDNDREPAEHFASSLIGSSGRAPQAGTPAVPTLYPGSHPRKTVQRIAHPAPVYPPTVAIWWRVIAPPPSPGRRNSGLWPGPWPSPAAPDSAAGSAVLRPGRWKDTPFPARPRARRAP